MSAPTYSFEVFPPRRTAPVDTIFRTLAGLEGLHPDFISVTYGAAGARSDSTTVRIASTIQDSYHIPAVAHLTCLYLTRQEAEDAVTELGEAHVGRVLALRGDRVEGRDPAGDFPHACDLVGFLRERGFDVLAACYPECHPEAEGMSADIDRLKEKVDAGAGHLISQLFLNNVCFYQFLARARTAGIAVPIEAGIMPVVNERQIRRMVSLCGAELPEKFRAILDRYGSDDRAMRDAGIAYAVDQIVDLVAHGVDGIHLYTMNDPVVARRITEATSSLLGRPAVGTMDSAA